VRGDDSASTHAEVPAHAFTAHRGHRDPSLRSWCPALLAGPGTAHASVASTLTFLLTDIEGSTKLWVQHPAANAPAVALVCRRLDGISLAIELAAGRLNALPVEAIAAWLSDRFRLRGALSGAVERGRWRWACAWEWRWSRSGGRGATWRRDRSDRPRSFRCPGATARTALRARALLAAGQLTYNAAWAEGGALSVDERVALALGETPAG
jgi:hypothetical protein